MRVHAVRVLAVCLFLCLIALAYFMLSSTQPQSAVVIKDAKKDKELDTIDFEDEPPAAGDPHNSLSSLSDHKQLRAASVLEHSVNYNIHVFYYAWFGSPTIDGKWLHWNHEYIQHWNKETAKKWPEGRHTPPDDLGASFYPQLGAYSSKDPLVIDQHMKWIAQCKIGVLALSWYPPNQSDQNEVPSSDEIVEILLNAAQKYAVKIALHVEPYRDRSIDNLRTNIEYIVTKYAKHPAFYYYKSPLTGKRLPLVYLYDSYQIKPKQWAELLKPTGSQTIRDTRIDVHMIGLVVEAKHRTDIVAGGFDGFYTYFGAESFSHGASLSNWPSLQVFAKKNKLLFIPSVAPGYDDVRVRPWNLINSRGRQEGQYYEDFWKMAMQVKASVISITSFNEWHEGSQIEPAIEKTSENGDPYLDYKPHKPDYYLNATRKFVQMFERNKWDI